MAAVVTYNEWNGELGSQTSTPKAGEQIKFKSADDSDANSDNPLVKPNAGVYRSYEKWIRLSLGDLDESASVTNLEAFVTGSANTGIVVLAKTEEAYATPLAGGYSVEGKMTGDKTNIFLYTSDSPLSLGVDAYTEDDADSGIGSYLVMQMEVFPSANDGDITPFNLVVRYDEE